MVQALVYSRIPASSRPPRADLDELEADDAAARGFTVTPDLSRRHWTPRRHRRRHVWSDPHELGQRDCRACCSDAPPANSAAAPSSSLCASTSNWSTPPAGLLACPSTQPLRASFPSPGSHGNHWEVQVWRGRPQNQYCACRRARISISSHCRGYTGEWHHLVVQYRHGTQQARHTDRDRPRDMGAGASPPRDGTTS